MELLTGEFQAGSEGPNPSGMSQHIWSTISRKFVQTAGQVMQAWVILMCYFGIFRDMALKTF